MSIERIFYCDGPECEHHVRSSGRSSFLTITERNERTLHFCGWDCILRHAAAKEPETVISGSSLDAA